MLVEVKPTEDSEHFIASLQEAFRREDGSYKFRSEALPRFFRRTGATLLNVLADKKVVGGAVVIINTETQRNKLALFFINEGERGRGVGYLAWRAIEERYPRTLVWYTSTAWQDKRNVYFYLNKCGFVAFSIYDKQGSYLAMEKVMR